MGALGHGDGTFGTEMDDTSGAGGVRAVTADFNGDGKKDIAFSSGQILLGDGAGHFTLLPGTLPTVAVPQGQPTQINGIAAGDFNRDSIIDLALTNSKAPSVDLYLGHGDGNPDLSVGTASGGIFMTDVGAGGYFISALGNGDGTFPTFAHAYLPNITKSALPFTAVYDLADFNGDKKPDIVSLDMDSSGAPQLRVRAGAGNGSFTDMKTTPIHAPTIVGGQGNVNSLLAADFNGDSLQDVAFVTTPLGSAASTISVVKGNGDGSFADQIDYPSPGVVLAMAMADLNRDKKPGIAIDVFLTSSSNAATPIQPRLSQAGSGSHSPHKSPRQPGAHRLVSPTEAPPFSRRISTQLALQPMQRPH